jgi:transcription elongation factor Elf1
MKTTTHTKQGNRYQVKPLATDRNNCPRCGKSHSIFTSPPSYVDANGTPFRSAACGQRFVCVTSRN